MSDTIKMFIKKVFYVCFAVIVVFCVYPGRFATYYDFIDQSDIYNNLVQSTNNNLTIKELLIKCDYSITLNDNSDPGIPIKNYVLDGSHIDSGGEFSPESCNSRFSTAIIVPYRNREEQLNVFLSYMHTYLPKQNIHYRIFIIEQYDEKPFNRAKLLNIGAVIAMKYGFPCLILHDVDLLPLDNRNIYACTELPRHMSASLDVFRFNLPYNDLFGGVVAIQAYQFRHINGMSNMFSGWGGEDDDLFERLKYHRIEPCRFSPSTSRYTMLTHKKAVPSDKRLTMLHTGPTRYKTDGLNSLVFREKALNLHPLFTHVIVEI